MIYINRVAVTDNHRLAGRLPALPARERASAAASIALRRCSISQAPSSCSSSLRREGLLLEDLPEDWPVVAWPPPPLPHICSTSAAASGSYAPTRSPPSRCEPALCASSYALTSLFSSELSVLTVGGGWAGKSHLTQDCKDGRPRQRSLLTLLVMISVLVVRELVQQHHARVGVLPNESVLRVSSVKRLVFRT